MTWDVEGIKFKDSRAERWRLKTPIKSCATCHYFSGMVETEKPCCWRTGRRTYAMAVCRYFKGPEIYWNVRDGVFDAWLVTSAHGALKESVVKGDVFSMIRGRKIDESQETYLEIEERLPKGRTTRNLLERRRLANKMIEEGLGGIAPVIELDDLAEILFLRRRVKRLEEALKMLREKRRKDRA